MPKTLHAPRAVIYVRLSRESEESTSVESQTAACRAYAESRGWEVLFVAEDVDVSGATRLENREGMAKVLAALPRTDYVIAAKLDRYARSVLEFSRLLKAGDDTGATLVTADGTLAPETSRIIVHVLSAFAEYEREMISARTVAAKKHLRRVGRWSGGVIPYGYQVVRRDGGAYLDVDPEAAAIVRECARRILEDGASITGIVRDLNSRGVPSPADHSRIRRGRKPRGTKWTNTALRGVLITPAVRGWLVQTPADGKRNTWDLRPELDEHGEPRQIAPELLDAETYAAVRARLAERSRGRGVSRSGRAVLLHVATCGVCEAPMYHGKRTERGKDYSVYACRDGHRGNNVNAAGLEQVVETEFLAMLGRFELMREVPKGGRDVTRELRETATAIEHLAGNLAKLSPGGTAASMAIRQLEALERKHAALLAEQAESDGNEVEYVPTGRTIADEWQRRDTEGRNALLREFGVDATVFPHNPGARRRFDPSRVRVEIHGPEWLRNGGHLLAEAA